MAERTGPLNDATLEAMQATYEALSWIEMSLGNLLSGDQTKADECRVRVSRALQVLRNVDQRIYPRPRSPEESN